MEDGFLNGAHENTNKFYKIMFEMFPFYMNLYGTKCTVRRLVRDKELGAKPTNKTNTPSRDQIINQVYGKVASRDMYDSKSDVKMFSTMLIINRSHVQKYYNNQSDNVTIYHNEKILDLGDEISYNRDGKTFSFIVLEMNCYEDVIYEYVLIGIKDYISRKENNDKKGEVK